MASFPALQSYSITEKLGESLQAIVYKAYLKANPKEIYVIKVLKLLSNSDEQTRYLRQKIQRLKVLHVSGTSTPIALESYGEQPFLVQPWFAGVTLNDWATQKSRTNLQDFFSIACMLTDILQAVHDAGITHGGVKPHNILVEQGTLDVHLIDFITPLDIRDVSHFIYDAEFVRDTLAYTSPEQTGRINYRVDFSTDLYSLGIVFYELLTGKLPFFSRDPLELIHSHLAEEAPLAHEVNLDVPPQLSKIIFKLVLKQPEKRYQSASGLLADLIRCHDDFKTSNAIAEFPVGMRDCSKRVIFISKMVGRLAECKLITDEYRLVTSGLFRSIFISGLSGIGKTRLIQELQKPLVVNRGYFTSGKFDQYQKNVPYSSLIQALRHLMRTFLTESDSRLEKWKYKILKNLEQDGRVITDVVPELEFVIGKQPKAPPLPPVEARNRFNNLLGKFLATLADSEHPLVLFIDDLQWCDVATLDFLSYLFATPDEHPFLMFIGAYRHNEVDSSHPLTKLMRSIQTQHGALQSICLDALNEQDCHEMVAYILDSSLEATENLAVFIARLTEGNPLFINESLAWLYNERLLSTDDQKHWQWDMNKICDTRMPKTVVELFSSKVHNLNAQTIEILNYCACMGNRFTAGDVCLVLNVSLEYLFKNLKQVLSIGLLLENKSDLQFVHDRVQEAVLKQLDETARPAIHWRIGKRLLKDTPAGSSLEAMPNLFTIALHLNQGCPQNPDKDTRYCLLTVNFHAGNKALNALATVAANEFFRSAFNNLPDNCWELFYEPSYRIYQRLAKTELMCGRYEASETLLNQLIEHANSDFDKAEALAEQTSSLSSFGNFTKAITTANRGLAYFNKAIPEDAEMAQLKMQKLMAAITTQDDVFNTILNMPFTSERESKIELGFYSELIPDLYMSGLVPQLYLSAAQSTELCLSGGMDESVIYSFSIMGLNLGEQEQFQEAFRYQDLAHELCAKYPNTFGATRGMNGIVWCNMHSRSHPSEIASYCLKAIQCGKNCGDLYNAGLSYGPLMWNMQVQGKNCHAIEQTANECLQFSRKNALSFSVALAEAVLAGFVAPMKADYQPVDMRQTLIHWQENNYVAASGSYFVLLAISQYYSGDYQAADASLKEVEKYLHGLTDNVLKRQWYVFRIVNLLRFSGQRDEADVIAEILPLKQKLTLWATLGPLLKPYLALIEAELARFLKQFQDARNSYLYAIVLAEAQQYTLLTGHLYEALGELLNTIPTLGNASLYYREALRQYRLCYAESKIAHLLEHFQETIIDNFSGNNERAGETDKLSTLPNLDINYLMKSALALSAETDLQQLLQKIMNVVLECSGAQHGYLFIKEQDVLLIAAENHIGKKPVLQTKPYRINESIDVCLAIVNYVFRTGEKVLLRDGAVEGDFQSVPEVQTSGLRSVLCLPVIKQGELIGVLYLENRLSAGIFTQEKTGMTELITSHVAISLENARLLEETQDTFRQLQESRENMMLMEKLSALGTLVGGVAHEINNPLMGVVNYVEYAESKVTDDKVREVLKQALHEIGRIKTIVANMLIYLPTKSNKNASCKIQEIVSQTLLLLKGEFQKANIDVSINIADDLPEIPLGSDSLQQVLINLLLNARDALATCKDPHICLTALEVEAGVEISVCDNGTGIEESIMKRMFDPFFTTKPPGKGTGLGLSISHRLIEKAGGTIIAYNNADGGCCMTLQFQIVGKI